MKTPNTPPSGPIHYGGMANGMPKARPVFGSPLYFPGMTVEVVRAGDISGERFVGRRFRLGNRPDYVGGAWSWAVPLAWSAEVFGIGSERYLMIPEPHLRPEYDGRVKLAWDQCLWRPNSLMTAKVSGMFPGKQP